MDKSPVTSARQARILVVDDDESVLRLATEALEAEGFAVFQARNGTQGIDLFRKVNPDIVLTDAMMPVMDGLEFCSRLRRFPNTDQLPVIVLTGLEDIPAVQRAYEVGATDFIGKPFNGIVLSHRVRYILKASENMHRLKESRSCLAQAQRIAHLGNWEWSIPETAWSVSEEFLRILDLPQDSSMDLESFLLRVHPDDRGQVKNSIEQVVDGGHPTEANYRISGPGGSERFIHGQTTFIVDPLKHRPKIVGTIQDITELKQAEKKIQFLAYYDAVTGLPNRSHFKERLEQSLAYAKRHSLALATLFIDLDHFKKINDTLGHSMGDMLLHDVGSRIRDALRVEDVAARFGEGDGTSGVARLGGDEFTVILTSVKYAQDVARVAQRLLSAVSMPFALHGQEVVITASIGISLFPNDGGDAETLIQHADTAMYHAKTRGRNAWEFFSPAMNDRALDRLALETDLRKSLENGNFIVHYQPQVCLRTGNVVGAEALVRWQHPALGLLQPARFLPVAREVGLMSRIDDWVLQEACIQGRSWQCAGLAPIRIAVNLSNELFWKSNLVEQVQETLAITGINPGLLELEMTENILLEDSEKAIQRLRALASLGVGLCIDDFGTGFSSLGNLKYLPFGRLKIDRSFVRNITSDPTDAAIVTTIIALGHQLKRQVLAEGVESQEQLEEVVKLGCDLVQGFLLGRPEKAEKFTSLLRSAGRSGASGSTDKLKQLTESARVAV